jgi:hypothetical protein
MKAPLPRTPGAMKSTRRSWLACCALCRGIDLLLDAPNRARKRAGCVFRPGGCLWGALPASDAWTGLPRAVLGGAGMGAQLAGEDAGVDRRGVGAELAHRIGGGVASRETLYTIFGVVKGFKAIRRGRWFPQVWPDH